MVSGLTLVAGLLAILSLPEIYASKAKILVERQDTFSRTELGAVAGDTVDRRMQLIISTVLSTQSIKDMLVENGVIDKTIPPEELEEVSETFRNRASLTIDNVAVVNPYTGKSGMYSQGIDIAFEDEDPVRAFAITESLAERILQANRGKGESAAAYERSFLQEQHKEALARLTQAREAVAKYKNENALFVPELHPLAIRRYEEIENQHTRAKDDLARLRRDLDEIRGELAISSADAFVLAADGTRILGPDEQLRLLEAEYARATSRYSASHPEVVRLRAELAGLRQYTSRGETSGIEAELQETRAELRSVKQRYSDEHPDVIALRRDIARLEGQLENRAEVAAPREASTASNPAYNRLKIREQSILDSLAREQQQLNSLDDQLAEVQEQLAIMPAVERDLNTLVLQQEDAQLAYDEIDAELDRLNMNAGMQEADLLDRFVLLEEPRIPVSPDKPHKKLLALILGMIAGTAGLLAATLLHIVRDRILDPDDVESLVDLPVYMIPRVA